MHLIINFLIFKICLYTTMMNGMKKEAKKLKEVTLTYQEWLDSLRTPTPVRNRKKYKRNEKHKNRDLRDLD